MIIDNYISYKKSEFYEIVNEITKFLRHPLPVKCDFWNGLNNERYRQFKSNYHKFKKYLCTNFLPRLLQHTLLIDTVQIFANTFHLSSKCSHKKRSLFHERFLTLLTHEHHLVEFYLAIAKTAFEIFQVITCSLGMTYNVNLRHTKSMMLNIVVFHAVYKSFFD